MGILFTQHPAGILAEYIDTNLQVAQQPDSSSEVEVRASAAYHQVHAITGCEVRATAAYFETLQNEQP